MARQLVCRQSSGVGLRPLAVENGLSSGTKPTPDRLVLFIPMEQAHAARVLEGISATVVGVLPDRSLSCHHRGGEDALPPNQQAHGQSSATADGGRTNRSHRRKGQQEPRYLAAHILDTKTAKFAPEKFKDKYETALKKLVKRKAAGQTIEPRQREEPGEAVVDLMQALKQSLGRGPTARRLRGAAHPPGAGKRRPRRRAA